MKKIHYQILLYKSNDKLLLNQTKIAKFLNKRKSTISYHINKLTKEGYINQQGKLTIRGKKACSIILDTSSEKGAKDIILRAHKLSFKSVIVQKSSKFDKAIEANGSYASFEMNNWRGYKKHFKDGVKVIFNPKSVIFNIPELIGTNPDELLNRASEVVFFHKRLIENEFPGLLLGTPSCIYSIKSMEIAFLNNEFAKLCKDAGISYLENERFKVDCSKGVNELESHNPVTSVNDASKVLDFYRDYVSFDLDWFELNELMKGEGLVQSTFKVVDKKINFIKERQDKLISFLAKQFGKEVYDEILK